MKRFHAVTSAFVLAALSLPSLAEEPVKLPGSVANVSIALTLNFMDTILFQKTEQGEYVLDGEGERIPTTNTQYSVTKGDTVTFISEGGYKLITSKYGNRELLTDLLEKGGYFPPSETSIRGWSLKEVATSTVREIYLVKKGQTSVKVTDEIAVTFTPSLYSGKLTTKVSGPADGVFKTASITGGYKLKGLFELGLDVPEMIRVNVEGVGVGSLKGKYPDVKEMLVAGPLPVGVSLLAVKGTGLFGTGLTADGSCGVEGSVSISGPAMIEDVNIFPDFGASEN